MIRPSAPRACGCRSARGVLLLAALTPAACNNASDRAPAVPYAAPGEPLPDLAPGERGRFFVGRALFERLATADEGLGPLYNAKRCSDCHDQPVVGGGGTRFPVLKATRFADGQCDLLEAQGGDNIQRRATELARVHGVAPEDIPENATATSSVVAPPLLGLGLLEAVPDSVLDEWADPEDADADGISGRLPRTPPGPDGGRPARFGRKGDAATIQGFVDAALRFELGFTTPDHPAEEPRNGVPVPPGADPMPDPEIDQATLDLLSDYVRLLAPPAPETASSRPLADTLAQGAALFRQIGCASYPKCGPVRPRTTPRWPTAPFARTPTCCCTTWGRPWPTCAAEAPPPRSFARRRCGGSATERGYFTTGAPRMQPRRWRPTGEKRRPHGMRSPPSPSRPGAPCSDS